LLNKLSVMATFSHISDMSWYPIHAHTHAYTRTHTYTRTHACIHAHMHTHSVKVLNLTPPSPVTAKLVSFATASNSATFMCE